MRDKRDLDEIDLEIVRLLADDARRPFSDIADRVGLSPPAVSDRVDRLKEQGIIRQFTVDIDRLKLQSRTPVIVELEVDPTHAQEVYESVTALDGIEHVFKTHDATVIAHGNAPDTDFSNWLYEGVEMEYVSQFEIKLVDQSEWSIEIDEAEFALTCPICGNTIDSEGVTAEIGGETKAFCCPSCKSDYEEQYETHQSNIG